MNELICPECKRFGMEHEGNGFLYCAWSDCGFMIHASKYEQPKVINHYKLFRDSIKVKEGY